MKCPLCQYEFATSDRNACASCGLFKGCALVKCPKCGYEFVGSSRIVDFFSRIVAGVKSKMGRRPQG